MTAEAPKSAEALYAMFDALGIVTETHQHTPVFTVAEGKDMKAAWPGGHSKNLFLKDKKGALFLVSALDQSVIDLNALSKTLGAARFSFGSAELLLEKLGVTPGSVTAFAVINDPDQDVRFVIDEALMAHERVYFHPLKNDATTAIAPGDLMRFMAALDRTPIRVAFPADGPPRLIEP